MNILQMRNCERDTHELTSPWEIMDMSMDFFTPVCDLLHSLKGTHSLISDFPLGLTLACNIIWPSICVFLNNITSALIELYKNVIFFTEHYDLQFNYGCFEVVALVHSFSLLHSFHGIPFPHVPFFTRFLFFFFFFLSFCCFLGHSSGTGRLPG